MKKTTTNRRKKLPLLLGALLIVSVAAYGTRAYFSDSETQQGNIALELGTVDIKAVETEDWKYVPVAIGEIESATNENLGATVASDGSIIDAKNITKVRPGDSFTRNYTFKNTGSLDVKLELDSNSFKGKDAFVTTIVVPANESIIKPNGEAVYTVTITVPDLDNNSYNNREGANVELDKRAVNYLGDNITVKAFQTNAKTSTKTSTPVE